MKKRKLKFDFRLTDYVDQHVIRIYILILVSALLLAIAVAVGISLYRYTQRRQELKKPGLYTEEDISSILKSPGLTDFIIPDSLDSGDKGFTMFRQSEMEWPIEIVERYIIPPEELGIEKIREENRKIIEDKLDDIP